MTKIKVYLKCPVEINALFENLSVKDVQRELDNQLRHIWNDIREEMKVIGFKQNGGNKTTPIETEKEDSEERDVHVDLCTYGDCVPKSLDKDEIRDYLCNRMTIDDIQIDQAFDTDTEEYF
jgi:hypothetical protein